MEGTRDGGSKTIAMSSASTLVHPNTIGKRIFKAVTQKLRYQHINASAMVTTRLNCLIPKAGSSAEQISGYKLLSAQPMAVSIMTLQLSDRKYSSRGATRRMEAGLNLSQFH